MNGIGKGIASLTLCAVAALAAIPAGAGAASFTNGTTISLPSTFNSPGNPYPSTINVTGLKGPIVKVKASILGYNDPNPAADFLLVGPTGKGVVLWSDECSGDELNGESFTFDDDAPPAVLPFDCGGKSGTFRPTGPNPDDSAFPGAASSFALGSKLADFRNTEANGAWRLFARGSTQGGLGGQLLGGWSLDIETAQVSDCAGQDTTIAGTAGNDVLLGTPGPDVFFGRAGRDTLKGLGGNDVICGGGGADRLIGGAGKDRLIGQGGKDSCAGNAGKDTAARTCEKSKSA